MMVQSTTPIKPNNEARFLWARELTQGDASQQWQMNSITHQLANVEYPNLCITNRPYAASAFQALLVLLVECIGKDDEAPNPQLHQRFYPKPVLDDKGEQTCYD